MWLASPCIISADSSIPWRVRVDHVRQQGKKLGRPKVPPRIENAIRGHLSTGNGTLEVPALVGCGSDTVRRVRRKMAE